jgi:queuosine precursor transporter
MYKKENLLYLVLGGFFVTNALIAEVIGSKIFSLEKSLGLSPSDFSFLGQDHLSYNLTAGVLLWPFVFIMTDIINEYYGKRGVKILSYLTVGLLIYAFAMLYAAMAVAPADFWLGINSDIQPSIDVAFGRILGQGLGIIMGSLVAFLLGQVIDVAVFHYIRQKSGEKNLWLRSTGSTLVSQLIDSFVVLFIAFYIFPVSAQRWSMAQVLAICLMNYSYKTLMAFALSPVIYLVHKLIDRYLGVELSQQLRDEAANSH